MRKSLIILVAAFFIVATLYLVIKNFEQKTYSFKSTLVHPTSNFKEIKLEKNYKNRFPDFDLTSNSNLLDAFGVTGKEALEKNPQILKALKEMDKNINAQSMDTGSENMVAVLNGKNLVLLNGCIEKKEDSKCDGTVRIVAIDLSDDRIYMLAENGSGKYAADPKVYIYGDPPEQIENLLLYAYYY